MSHYGPDNVGVCLLTLQLNILNLCLKSDYIFGMVRPTCIWADEAAEQQFHEFPAEFAHLSVAWQQCE